MLRQPTCCNSIAPTSSNFAPQPNGSREIQFRTWDSNFPGLINISLRCGSQTNWSSHVIKKLQQKWPNISYFLYKQSSFNTILSFVRCVWNKQPAEISMANRAHATIPQVTEWNVVSHEYMDNINRREALLLLSAQCAACETCILPIGGRCL